MRKKIQDIIKEEEGVTPPKDITIIENIPKEEVKPSMKIKEIEEDFGVHNLSKKKINYRIFLWVFIFLATLVGVYYLFDFFAVTKVSINAKEEPFSFQNENFTATKGVYNTLGYELMIVDATEKKNVVLTETKTEDQKAKGKVVIYNEYSTKPQKLSINTKLIDTNNLVYLIDQAVSIPGYTKVSGKIIPGSVSVSITAQAVGDKYNGEPRDFAILGFSKTPKYTKIYVRSDGPITGGSTGLVYILSAQRQGELLGELKINLKDKLTKKIKAQVPPEYMLYDGSLEYSLDSDKINFLESKTAETVVVLTGKVYAPIFKEKNLEQFLVNYIQKDGVNSELENVSVEGLKNLVYAPTSVGQLSKDISKINFSLKGDGKLLWHPNIESLKAKLSDLPKENFTNIISEDIGIESANLKIIPVWKHSLSKNPSRIHIKVTNN